MKSPELVYDIVQDTFIKLWENRMEMVNAENIRGFLFITTKNSSITYLRRAAIDRNAREKILESYTFSSSSDTEYYTIDR